MDTRTLYHFHRYDSSKLGTFYYPYCYKLLVAQYCGVIEVHDCSK